MPSRPKLRLLLIDIADESDMTVMMMTAIGDDGDVTIDDDCMIWI